MKIKAWVILMALPFTANALRAQQTRSFSRGCCQPRSQGFCPQRGEEVVDFLLEKDEQN